MASRRSCQKCRFLKCIAVGMTAAWVLSEEQCTIRSNEYNRSFSFLQLNFILFQVWQEPRKMWTKEASKSDQWQPFCRAGGRSEQQTYVSTTPGEKVGAPTLGRLNHFSLPFWFSSPLWFSLPRPSVTHAILRQCDMFFPQVLSHQRGYAAGCPHRKSL